MSEGYEIPIGVDLTELHAAQEKMAAAFQQVSARISGSFEKSNAAIANSSSRMVNLSSTAGNLGNAVSGAAAGMNLLAKASRALTGVNLAQHLSNLVTRAGGIRAAFARIPAAMSAIASNPTLRKIVIGAAGAAAAILAIRTAWRTAAAATRLLRNAASTAFAAVVSGASRAAAAVRGVMGGIASLPGKIGGMIPGLSFAPMIGGLGGLAAAVTLAVASVNKASQMETLETAFAPLIGGSEAAKDRIAELSAFAAATPFELPEIAKASRVLEVLTKGALSTGKGLTMVGDVAAATQQPFDELAMWIGRLYDGLQSGRPVGEAMARLQELGAVSGDVRGRIEALQKSGASGDAIWGEAAAALGRFSGSMERQSATWSGKLSTLRDEIGVALAAFGRPIIDGLKPIVDMLIEKIKSMQDEALALGQKIQTAFGMAIAAFQTGNVAEMVGAGLVLAAIRGVNAFSGGIRGAVAYLGTALSEIMSGIGENLGLQNLLGIFMDLGEALGAAITGALAKAVQSITGMDMSNEIAQAQDDKKHALNMAGYRMENLDGAAAMSQLADSMAAAHAAGAAAMRTAMQDPLLDESKAREKWIEAMKPVAEQFEKNKAEAAARQREMDERLKNGGSSGMRDPSSAFETIARAVQPAVTSLGRVGGGGGGGFSPVVSEQKRTNSLLTRIEKKLGGNPTPAIA
jgi:hypothetical protein